MPANGAGIGVTCDKRLFRDIAQIPEGFFRDVAHVEDDAKLLRPAHKFASLRRQTPAGDDASRERIRRVPAGGDHAHAPFIGKLQLSGVAGDCLCALDGQKCAAFAARNRRARIGFGSAADDAASMLVQLAVKIGKSGFIVLLEAGALVEPHRAERIELHVACKRLRAAERHLTGVILQVLPPQIQLHRRIAMSINNVIFHKMHPQSAGGRDAWSAARPAHKFQ